MDFRKHVVWAVAALCAVTVLIGCIAVFCYLDKCAELQMLRDTVQAAAKEGKDVRILEVGMGQWLVDFQDH